MGSSGVSSLCAIVLYDHKEVTVALLGLTVVYFVGVERQDTCLVNMFIVSKLSGKGSIVL